MGNSDFRVGGRIFATLWTEEDRVVVRLTPALQAEMIDALPDIVSPTPGSWGARGWTNVELDPIDDDLLRTTLLAAWRTVAPPGLIAEFEPV